MRMPEHACCAMRVRRRSDSVMGQRDKEVCDTSTQSKRRRSDTIMEQLDEDYRDSLTPSKRRKRAARGNLLKLPNDLLRVVAVVLLGGNEGGAEEVVRAWLSLRLACKQLWTSIADVPLDLRFSNPLSDTQVLWMMESAVKLRSVVFTEWNIPFMWLEVACVRRCPTAICRSWDTLEMLQGLVLGRQGCDKDMIAKLLEMHRTPLPAEMASELGPVTSYHLQGFSRLTSLALQVDRSALFTLPPSLEVLRLGYVDPCPWRARPVEDVGLASTGMGPINLPRLRSLRVDWTHRAGTKWLPLLLPTLESVHMSSDCYGVLGKCPPRCWGQDWPRMVNIKSLVFRDLVCPFDVAVRDAEELRLETCVKCISSARRPHDVLRLFLSGRVRRLICLPDYSCCLVRDTRYGGISWIGEGERISLKEVVSVAESPEFQPYVEVHSCGGRMLMHHTILKRSDALQHTWPCPSAGPKL
eukprot:jgi/Botrbrau1/1771/Bobra.0217s0026.1